jgi:hypothetical protein
VSSGINKHYLPSWISSPVHVLDDPAFAIENLKIKDIINNHNGTGQLRKRYDIKLINNEKDWFCHEIVKSLLF